jgi:hypothetical protein
MYVTHYVLTRTSSVHGKVRCLPYNPDLFRSGHLVVATVSIRALPAKHGRFKFNVHLIALTKAHDGVSQVWLDFYSINLP